MTSVLIVDDQPNFRRQLGELLRGAGLEIVGEADSIAAAEILAQAEQPDLAIVDVMLPDVNGIEGIPCLKQVAPAMRILLVSAYHDSFELFQKSARQAGAEAFFSKDEIDLDLISQWFAPKK